MDISLVIIIIVIVNTIVKVADPFQKSPDPK